MKRLIILAILALNFCVVNAQISFNSMVLETNFRGYIATAISDMNNDYLDDIVRVSFYGDVSIAYQQTDGSFDIQLVDSVEYNGVDYGSWSICIADVNNDIFKDIFIGNRHFQFVFITDGSASNFVRTQLDSVYFAQGANFVDIDMDGDLDLFVCNDDSSNFVYANDGMGNFVIDTNLVSTHKSSGNYGSVWSDYDNDGDLDLYLSKCKGGVTDSTDPRRVNLLYRNDNGVYTEVANAANVDDGSQSWCADFGDIDNDGDFDLIVVNHYAFHRLYENNGDGTFTKITSQAGIDEYTNAGVWQSIFTDLDNDGWLDLIMATEDNGKIIYQNDGDGTFTLVENPLDSNKLYSVSIGDLNNDGFTDMYSIRKNQPPNVYDDEIHFNNGNSNNYLGVTVLDNDFPAAIGTKNKLYGNWGVQTRELRAGESYGIHNSFQKIFGLGNETSFDSVVIGNCTFTSVANLNSKYVIDISDCSISEIKDTTKNILESYNSKYKVYSVENDICINTKEKITKSDIKIFNVKGQIIPFELKSGKTNYRLKFEDNSSLIIVNINNETYKVYLND